MSKEKCVCTDNETICAAYDCSNRVKTTIKKSMPPLSYELIEGNFKHLQGQVLTAIEAVIPNDNTGQQSAIKSLIKGFFNDKLTHLFEMCGNYGLLIKQETPDYSHDDNATMIGCNKCNKTYISDQVHECK